MLIKPDKNYVESSDRERKGQREKEKKGVGVRERNEKERRGEKENVEARRSQRAERGSEFN